VETKPNVKRVLAIVLTSLLKRGRLARQLKPVKARQQVDNGATDYRHQTWMKGPMFGLSRRHGSGFPESLIASEPDYSSRRTKSWLEPSIKVGIPGSGIGSWGFRVKGLVGHSNPA